MRIGIDAQTILNPKIGDVAGLGHYTYHLIDSLLSVDQKNEFVLFFNYKARKEDIEKFRKKNVTIRRFPFSYYKKFLPLAYSETLATAFFLRDRLDVLFVPGGRVPITYKKKIVVTGHNLALKKFPELFSKKENLKSRIKPAAFSSVNKSATVAFRVFNPLERKRSLFFLMLSLQSSWIYRIVDRF